MIIPEIEELIQKEEYVEAEKLCKQLVQHDPENVESNVLLSRILTYQGKYDDAISFLLELEKKNSENFDIHFLLGILYEQIKGDLENALIQYRAALSIDYRSSAVNYRIGNILNNYNYEEKDESGAKRYYQNAVNGDKPIEDAYHNLALLEKSKKALVILRHGLTYFPQSIQLYESLANKYFYFFDDPEACIKVIREASAKGVESDELKFLAINSCIRLSQYPEAISYLDLLDPEEHKPNLMALKCVRAIALMESGNFSESINILLETINTDLENDIGYNAHHILVCAYFRNGEIPNALSIFSDISINTEQTDFVLMLYPMGIFDCEKYFIEAIDFTLKTSDNKNTMAIAKGFRAMHLYRKLSEAEASISKIDISDIDVNAIERDLRDSVEFFPDNVNLNRILGEILYKTNKWFDSARYLIRAQLISEEDEYIDIQALNKIYGNKSRLSKFFQIVDELIEDYSIYEKRFAKFIMPNIISFLFEKKNYKTIVDFANKFHEEYWEKEKVLFEIAYSQKEIGNKKVAKKFYNEYLNTIGENQAVLNNLANIYSDDGDFSEAERLYNRAIELGSEKSEKNLENLKEKKREVEEHRQSVQRAAILYAREDKKTRRAIATIYKSRLDNDLILYSSSPIAEYFVSDTDSFLQNITNKKYFEIVDDHNLPLDGVVLRLNPLLVDSVQKELRDEQKENFFEDISSSLSSRNLEEKYNYDELLISKLEVVHSQELRILLERDLREVALAMATQSYKAATILCGSIVEAVLLDQLLKRKETVVETLKRLREKQNKGLKDKEKKIEDWTLETFLDVAFEEKIISYNLFYWGNGIRGFRNLVHPALEQRKELSVSKENAEIAWSIVKKLLSEIQ